MKKTLLIFTLLFFTLSCGQNGQQQQVVKEVNLLTSIENDEAFLSFAMIINIGTTNLTSITLPIINPLKRDIQYGSVSFRPTLQPGLNEIKVKLNLSKMAKKIGGFAKLPNGDDLPVAGMDESRIIELEIEEIHSKVYLALQPEHVMMGFAIAIKEFDVLNGHIPGANIFLGFDVKGVYGLVGMFTGNDPWESGLATFIDLGKYIGSQAIKDLLAGKKITPASMSVPLTASVQRQRKSTMLVEQNLTPEAMSAIHSFLQHHKRKTLHFIPRSLE